MSTILGPLPCQACRQPVHVVRRTVEVPCRCRVLAKRLTQRCGHMHVIPDAAWTVVEADGERHLCEAAAA